ncbi:tetraspanin-18 [Aethina tumida]|uniref:tetraspanin-18 n=1 Tax=Aethina tumida TaxID=116153 RepID=UPI00096B43BF|nr:tetraspanin-18 [Aethina tumida]
MVYDCGSCLAKYILCGFNFLIFLAGSLVLAIGTWLAVDKSSFIGLSKIVPSEDIQQFTQPGVIEQVSYVMIAIGGFMFIVSFLGYCGALRESQCMLTTYGILLLVILILEITAAGLAIGYKSKAEEETKNLLKTTISKYYTGSESGNAVTLSWDHLQAGLQCCGVDDYTDYQKNEIFAREGKVIPESCCVLEGDPLKFKPLASTCTTSPNDVNSYYKKGCFQTVVNLIMSNLNIVIFTCVGLGLIEIIGIFFAFCLTKSINGPK